MEQKFEARCANYDQKGNYHYKVAAELVSRAGLQPGWNVLDVACGTGLATFLAASEVGQTGSVTGVDLSSGMVEKVCAWSTQTMLLVGITHDQIGDCRQSPNRSLHPVPMFLFLWRMQRMRRSKAIPLMQFCLHQECPIWTQK